MTLTEEQREALAHAINYIDETDLPVGELDGFDREVLRAMIDSSEHFTDASKMIGFDLERAREAIEEAVDRLSQKIGDEDGPIWEKEPEKAAVLQTLPDEIAHLEKWMIKNRDAATELQYQLDDAIKEDERLRAALDESEQILAHKTKTATHWYEEGLKTRADLVQSKRVVEQQATRIKALEDALAEERAQRLRVDPVEAWRIPGVRALGCRSIDEWALDEARRQLIAEGKIGPDAKPHCWQITEERKAALWHAINVLKENDIMEEPEEHLWDEEVTVLQAMLTEAGQE